MKVKVKCIQLNKLNDFIIEANFYLKHCAYVDVKIHLKLQQFVVGTLYLNQELK